MPGSKRWQREAFEQQVIDAYRLDHVPLLNRNNPFGGRKHLYPELFRYDF